MTTEYLLDREVDRVLAALTEPNRLVCEVMLHTGLRVSDVLTLRTAQIKPKFWVTEAKTGKRKQVGLPGPLLARLRAQAGSVYVFEGRKGPETHRSRQAVWTDIHRAAKAFRLDRIVGSHTMRKVYAVKLMDRYGDIERVQRALNHDRVTTTMIYAAADKLLQARLARKRARRGKCKG